MDRRQEYCQTLQLISALQRNLILIKFGEKTLDPCKPDTGTIDVWWRGKANGQLMLIFAHLPLDEPCVAWQEDPPAAIDTK